VAIREHADASEAERQVDICNSGVMAFRGRYLPQLLESIGNDNAKQEYYLTDAVEVALGRKLRCAMVLGDEDEVLGVNSRAQLAKAEAIMQQRLREEAMENGATLIDPASVTFSHDTVLGRDVVVEPHVFFGPGVVVGNDVMIKGFSHLEQTRIKKGAMIGPFARLRPGADIGPGAKVGNFVEIKKSNIAGGAKVSHLTYIGDADIGEKANIGAGTITCNYDGFNKARTIIGAGAFIGSNSSLIAPVNIGAGAYIGSGSALTGEVEADSLVITRAKRRDRPGWAAVFRRENSRDTTSN
jgi:bifunctional UDP-N-acetylglucosamine pyrophosphorylase/glucosamine-1-phosphate N-acetyltransferase